MSDNSNSQDSLSDLLDSFSEEDEVLSEKMNSFAKSREELKKIEKERLKNLPDNEYTIKEEFIIPVQPEKEEEEEEESEPVVIPPLPPEDVEDTSGETMVFRRDTRPAHSGDTNNTIVYDNRDIQNLKKEETGPRLVRKPVEEEPEKEPSRLPLILTCAVIGIALGALLIFGITNWVMPALTSQPETSEGYEEIISWAKGYDSLSDSQKSDIINYESIYNKLSDSQKEEVNKILQSLTGKTFDELLAEATSKDKDDSSNNNTQVAEKKAALKKEIASLESELSDLQARQTSENDAVNSAYAAMQDAQSVYETAQSDKTAADSAYASAVESYNKAISRQSELQDKVTDNTITPEEQKELDSMEDTISSLETAMNTAASQVTAAETEVNNAYAVYTQAVNDYNSTAASTGNYDQQIADLENQISQKQAQLDALK